ncbi:diguanylate cyclase [Belnapia sp. T18]|uniref:Diguanylate cyclase n=1 Tax=Belnapia arida TaxID=2804533 RepID=A0ABS1U1R7_9PROT|nr:diguanylate cyclase [Belnapia arida]
MARLGGDEFAAILPGRSTAETIAPLAERLMRVVGHGYALDDTRLDIGVSLGIALAPEDGPMPIGCCAMPTWHSTRRRRPGEAPSASSTRRWRSGCRCGAAS